MAFTKIRKVKSTKAMVSILVVSIFLLSGLALSMHTDLTGSVSGQPGHTGYTPSQEFANLTPVTSYVPPDQAYGITGSTIHQNNTVMGNMQIVVGFQPSNIKQLREYINLTENPQSSMYGKFLTRGEFDSLFSANKSAYSSMITYLHRFGVSSITTFADRLSLSFNATSTQASEIFNVSFATYTSGNVLYHAPVSNPELPVSIEGSVSGINGLSNYSLNVIHDAGLSYGMEQTLNGASNQSVSGYPAPQTINGAQFVYGPDMQVAYGEQGLFKNYGYPTHSVEATILWSGQYSGSTIKTPYGNITGGSYVGPYVPSNIYAYYNQTLPSGEPHSKVYGVPLGGSPPPGPKASYSTNGANMENTLDLEMMGSTAPGSSIYNVYSNSSSIASLDNAFSFILNPSSTYSALNNVSVISNSWGGSDGNSSIWYNDLMEAQARGITVLASSGDAGDNPSSRMWLGTNTEFPSSLAYNSFGMVAVGGTTVLLNSGLGISNQTNWYITPSAGGPDGTSSGISMFPEPSWQLSTSANQVIGGKGRAVPDVSALANNTLVTVSVNNVVHSYGFWGTSIASPIVGGIIASIDSVLYMKEKSKLGFADPVLYKLGNTQYSSTSEAMKPFYPVQYGENNVYHDRYGYSILNGWGTINAYNLTEQLLNKVTAATTYYKSTFTESNLPSGTPWFVNISGVPGSGKITGSSYSTTLKNGTYSYTVSTSSSQYYPSASTGSFTVSGKQVSISVTFQKKAPVITYYKTTFTESGLPSGTPWFVNITGISNSGPIKVSSYSTTLKNGTYSYTVSTSSSQYYPSASTGSFTVSGKQVSISVTFQKKAPVITYYKTTFTESGLPSGTPWFVNITGISNSGPIKVSSYSTTLKNGTYSYTVSTSSSQYYPSASTGSFTVSGKDSLVGIVFQKTIYNGTLSGIVYPGNSSITANNIVIHTVNGSFNQSLKDGSYNVSVSAYNYHPEFFRVNITDKHVVYVNISLSPLNSTYLINGYVSPSSASISFGEKNVSVNGSGYYNVWLAKGNYTVSVVHSGYTPLISNITVTGNVTGLNFTLVKQPVLTQKITISNITVIGYNVTVKNLTAHNGNISVSFNASTNGTLIISIPFSKLGNINASELHSSLVYISGQKYGDFQIAFSSGNGSKSVLLIVKNLSGDPTLYWIYTPLNAGSHTISVRNSKLMLSSEILIAGLLVFMGILVAYVRRGNRKH
ncbi:MAG: protease pro-enzyme activation domain-containing protein [Thermoplasmataceae archaeon]